MYAFIYSFIIIGARFGFDTVQYRVNEGAGSVTLFVVLLEGTLEREVNLQFSTVEGTATASGIVKINFDGHLRDTTNCINGGALFSKWNLHK